MNDLLNENLIPFLSTLITPYAFMEVSMFILLVSVTTFLLLKRRTKPSSKPHIHRREGNGPGVAVIIPAYNEAAVIVDSLSTVINQTYKDLEIIVVNDGSRDKTLKKLRDNFELYEAFVPECTRLSTTGVAATYRSRKHKNLVVIDKLRSGKGKGDALNVGIGYAKKELICVVDADSVLKDDAIEKLTNPFIKDKRTMAAGGAIRCGNGKSVKKIFEGGPRKCWNPLILAQVVEYARIFFVDRVAYTFLNANYIISGAFGIFNREAVVAIGGYQCNNLAEDMALTIRLHRYFRENNIDYKIAHAPEATCWTEVPYNFKLLYRQRTRWHAGFIKAVLENRDLLFKRGHGMFGNFLLPYCMIGVMEPLFVFASFVLLFNYLAGNGLNQQFFMYYLIGHSIYTSIYLVAAIISNEFNKKNGFTRADYPIYLFPIWLIFGRTYDFINFSLRVAAVFKYLRNEHSWGEMERVGFTAATSSKTA